MLLKQGCARNAESQDLRRGRSATSFQWSSWTPSSAQTPPTFLPFPQPGATQLIKFIIHPPKTPCSKVGTGFKYGTSGFKSLLCPSIIHHLPSFEAIITPLASSSPVTLYLCEGHRVHLCPDFSILCATTMNIFCGITATPSLGSPFYLVLSDSSS